MQLSRHGVRMSKEILLSVLMPVHNAEHTVMRAAKSTLKAMPPNSELLVQLDGCSDGSLELLSSIQDDRLKISASKENIGVSATLNALLARASGQYVARMDADDVCLQNRFKNQLSRIQSLKSDLLFGKAILWNPKKLLPFIPAPTPSLSRQELDMALIRSNPLVHPTLLATKASLSSLGGYRQSAAEDYDLWLRARTLGFQIDRLNTFLILYRVHESQLTKQIEWQRNLNEDQALIQSLDDFGRIVLSLSSDIKPTLRGTSNALWEQVIAKFRPSFLLKWKLIGVKATLKTLVRGKQD